MDSRTSGMRAIRSRIQPRASCSIAALGWAGRRWILATRIGRRRPSAFLIKRNSTAPYLAMAREKLGIATVMVSPISMMRSPTIRQLPSIETQMVAPIAGMAVAARRTPPLVWCWMMMAVRDSTVHRVVGREYRRVYSTAAALTRPYSGEVEDLPETTETEMGWVTPTMPSRTMSDSRWMMIVMVSRTALIPAFPPTRMM